MLSWDDSTGDRAALTQDDHGAEVVLAVGEELPLRLDGAWEWDEPASTGPAVLLTRVDQLVDPGYEEWLLTWGATGTATVTAEGQSVTPPGHRRSVTLHVTCTG